jgi:hypothetical protein
LPVQNLLSVQKVFLSEFEESWISFVEYFLDFEFEVIISWFGARVTFFSQLFE